MIKWAAVSNGAVVLHKAAPEVAPHAEVAVVPVLAGEPHVIGGEVASLWRRLLQVEGVRDDTLSEDERFLVREFEAAGIATRDLADRRRVSSLEDAWFESFPHELVCALVSRLASERGLRCLILKGPALHAQGLRLRPHSGDVDILIDPSRTSEFIEVMRGWGWSPRADPMEGTPIPHSKTLSPPDWGCEIDIHIRYPGIEVDPDTAFRLLWEHAEELSFGGVRGFTLSIPAHAVIQALTLARPLSGSPMPEGKEATAAVLRLGGSEALRLAICLHAHGALQEELSMAFPHEVIPYAAIPPDWAWLSQPNPARAYLAMIRAMPPRLRPVVIWKIITLRSVDEGGRTEPLVRRWRRGVAQLLGRATGGS